MNRGVCRPAGLLEGTVLLLRTPLPVLLPAFETPDDAVTGVGAATECLDCFVEETDTFLLMPPNLRMLSAPALAVDPDLPKTVLARPGVVGVRA